ncbi:MAG: type II toxin-antitoxin system RelE/ParE family toxin [bacterium]
MKYKVIIRPEAEDDLKEAFLWYEDRRLGLGYDFLLQVDAGIMFIERNPEVNSLEYKGTRKHLIKRFPYKIIYLIEKERIIVLAVIHGKRSPNLLKKRLEVVNRTLQH